MKALKIIAGVFISAAFLFLAARGVDFEYIGRHLLLAKPLPLLAGAALFILAYCVRGIRWGVMLRSTSPRPCFRELISSIFIGGAANNVLPLRAGEFVRSFALRKFGGASAGTALSSIILERVIDGLTLLAIFVALIFIHPLPRWAWRVGIGAAILFGSGALVLALAFFFRERACRFVERSAARIKLSWAEKIAGLFHRLVDGLSLFSSGRYMGLAIFWSFIIWGLEAITYWFVGSSLGFEFSVTELMFLLVVLNFGLALPSSPGFVGTFEYACVLALGVFGYSQSAAFGFAVLMHALFWAILVLGGVAFGWIDHGGFAKLARAGSAKAASVR